MFWTKIVKEWYERPFLLQLLALARMRAALRRHNLHDTRPVGGERAPTPSRPRPRHRSYDGSGYDPADADMGRAGTRFDRNAPSASPIRARGKGCCRPAPAR
ncbi:hypothetical protein ACFQ0B_05835 [Nonomuraea thailandensis]